MKKKQIKVRVPATTANLGPGFDCLGMALDMWNELRVEVADESTVTVQGQGAGELPADKTNLVYMAIEHLFKTVGADMPGLRLHCLNDIPLRRGLGSSAAAIVGGLVAADLLLSHLAGAKDHSRSKQDLLELAVYLEGHPDNVAAALLGGLQLVAQEGNVLLSTAVAVPGDIRAVLFVPEMTIATEEARAVLPDSISMEDAVYNMGRVALLVHSLVTGRLENLPVATGDRLHQPYRQRLFPAMKVIFSAARDAGALGVFLSGSGSTILALTAGREMTVAYEMAEAARRASVAGSVKITKPTPQGAHRVGNGES